MKNGKAIVKVERGIELPDRKWAAANPLIAIMQKMKNGDSFLYPLRDRSALHYCARKAKVMISTRIVNETTVRCWRVQPRQY